MVSKYSSGSTAVVTETNDKENLDFESVPEFIREPRSASYKDSYALNKEAPKKDASVKKEPFYLRKDLYVTTTNKEADASNNCLAGNASASASDSSDDVCAESIVEDSLAITQSQKKTLDMRLDYLHSDYADIQELDMPKSAELEALWPGVSHHDIFHMAAKKPPGFYVTVGFAGGVLATLLVVWAFSWNWHGTPQTASADKKIVVAQSSKTNNAKPNFLNTNVQNAPTPVITKQVSSGLEVVVPTVSTYEVKSGDTLAGIAWQTYKRATPRLLDAICKANGMRSADVLSLGQKLVLPEYRPQPSQIAAGTSSSVQ
jgi:LysM repeat protein